MNTGLRLLPLAAALFAAACASPGSSAGRHTSTTPPPAPPIPAGITDVSYDWHGLVLVPFGVLLKDSPVHLHEVLLFHDEANRAEGDNRDCFSIEDTPPRFMGQAPDHYLLCFDHDRLSRIEAAVRLAADDAPQSFVRACALWLKNTASTQASSTVCEGRDGGVTFSARLGLAAGDTAATVSMTLTDTVAHEAVNGAPLAN